MLKAEKMVITSRVKKCGKKTSKRCDLSTNIYVYVCAGETMIQRDVLSTRGGVTPPLHVPIATGNSPAKTATKHI